MDEERGENNWRGVWEMIFVENEQSACGKA